MRCVNCGAEIEGGAKFCTHCGTPAAGAPPAPAAIRPKNNSVRNALLLVGAFLIVGLAAGYYAYTQLAYSPEASAPEPREQASVEAPPESLSLEPSPAPEPEAPPAPVAEPEPAAEPEPERQPAAAAPPRQRPPAEPSPVAAPRAEPAVEVAAPEVSVAPPEPPAPPARPKRTSIPEAPAPESEEEKEPPRPRAGSPILMPGAGAYGGSKAPPPGTPKSKDPDAPVPVASSFPSRPVAPPGPKTNGNVYWTGRLRKGAVIVVEQGNDSTGFVDGDYFPGKPIDVTVPSPAVQVIEPPNPDNGWKTAKLECLRSTKNKVTINIQWRLR